MDLRGSVQSAGGSCDAGAIVYGSVFYTSARFVAPSGGIRTIRADWILSWHLFLNASGPVNGSSFYCYLCGSEEIDITFDLNDITTGAQYQFPTTYQNQTSFTDQNVSIDRSFHTNLSLPILFPMTKGDTYQFVTTFVGHVQVQINSIPLAQATIDLRLGSAAGATRLGDVIIR